MADECSTKLHGLYFQALLFVLFLLSLVSGGQSQATAGRRNVSVSALFAFGDSTLDSGNNNYLVTPCMSDFLPYGRNFFGHRPTGRFSNGRLLTDFAASYLGLKEEVPAYLDPSLNLDDLITGVCFASAGSGFDTLTAAINEVLPMPQQIDYFRDYLSRLELQIGKDRKDEIINNAMFIVSAGTNDFATNYIPLPIRRKMFSVADYQGFVLQNLQEFLQGLRSPWWGVVEQGWLRQGWHAMQILLCALMHPSGQAQATAGRRNVSVSAVFAFGDSTLDSGNNNYLVTPYKSDFLPYGRDFFGHRPTGRFSNGRLLTDFAGDSL
ncbi:hypothetical protein J5N97_019603 [Dioscorea zingiberensis]|uniref:GDSL esterase/lipase n=1 Tax=Dioscorea zingiberensis TaxID=325984 RepID=A0A9D5HCM7_9LILI|nr:hypothetical protein J5N97_019603 [Dioscorea zingiberensis]